MSGTEKTFLPPTPTHNLTGCESFHSFANIKIAWLDYVRLGNWLENVPSAARGPDDHHEKRQKATGKKSTARWRWALPSTTTILMDEKHGQSQRRASYRSMEAYQLLMWDIVFSKWVENNTIPLYWFYRYPIIDDVVQLVCLATVFKGHTYPEIFKDPAPNEQRELRVNPKHFYENFTLPENTISIKYPADQAKVGFAVVRLGRSRINSAPQVYRSSTCSREKAKIATGEGRIERSIRSMSCVAKINQTTCFDLIDSTGRNRREDLEILFRNLICDQCSCGF